MRKSPSLPVDVYKRQIMSNVPAALLLSGFTDNYRALIVGTNIGGLGTLIASMASLDVYKRQTLLCESHALRTCLEWG